ncbi:pyridoxamine 5'-phosphate oxidase family protein [Nocardia cyriacigeorgica]|uniref:pyridoxamine 5'-phosphate oxidase family protein n=1 Tax=Nocardia cyriacigeorgica TaxID=135487 RepID=UPI002453E740|nr:pyridoxamine 5'-phosphate oxidase family protein [Nocardia cyriacigeorgica]
MEHYFALTFGPDEQTHQRRQGSHGRYEHMLDAASAPDGIGEAEAEFLALRDSFYLASTGRNGWPYVQHRGGPAGFVKVLGPTRLAWAERPGNRQYITAGHLDHDDRIAMIAMDYPNRKRLKLLGHARFDPDPRAEVLEQLGVDGKLEGLMTVEVSAFDWNCPKLITPRFTADEVRALTDPLRQRIRQLEAELAAARTGAAVEVTG